MAHHTLYRTAALCTFVVFGSLYLALVLRGIAALGSVPSGLQQAAGVALGVAALAVVVRCGRR